jgi:hypothetical protein
MGKSELREIKLLKASLDLSTSIEHLRQTYDLTVHDILVLLLQQAEVYLKAKR